MTDTQLLHQYVEHRDQQAFGQLVRMHIDVVYSAALRQARDPHLAEEITQKTFELLAQKAATLSEQVLLSGWLYNTARFVACDEVRKVQRRAKHEKKAAAMAEESRKAATPDKSEAWEDAEIVLDAAMSDLDEQTRDLLVLRYFEGQSIRDVAERFGLAEDTARKRISRAVDELRGIFARHGVVMSTTVLA